MFGGKLLENGTKNSTHFSCFFLQKSTLLLYGTCGNIGKYLNVQIYEYAYVRS